MHQDTKSSPAGILMPERPAGRQQHHQDENRDEEKSGEIAGEQIETIEKHADHTVSFPSHAYCRKQ